MKISDNIPLQDRSVNSSQSTAPAAQTALNMPLTQQSAQPQHNPVASLSDEGSQHPFPQGLERRRSDPEGLTLNKQSTRPKTTLAMLFQQASADIETSRPKLSRATSEPTPAAQPLTIEEPEPTPIRDAVHTPNLRLQQGKLSVEASTPNAMATLLKGTLGKPQQHYLRHHSRQQGEQQWLQDTKGHVSYIKTDKRSGLIALHRSAPLTSTQPLRVSALERQHTPSQTLLNHHSGVHPDQDGTLWRLHDQKRYSLNPELGTWQRGEESQAFSKMQSTANGDVYMIADKNQLTKLGSETLLGSSERSIDEFSVNQQGHIALLFKSDDDKQQPTRLELYSSLQQRDALTPQLHLQQAENASQGQTDTPDIQSIGMSDTHIFAIDKQNRLLRADLLQPGQTTLNFTEQPLPNVQHHLGDDVKLQGFYPEENGRIGLLVKDRHGHQHACPVDQNHRIEPGWNLSDSLKIDNTQGLDSLDTQAIHVEDFGRQGEMALHDNRLYAKDPHTQTWQEQAKDVQSLQRGQDGQAYVVQDGELKTITRNEKSDSIRFGSHNLFSLPHESGGLSLEDSQEGMPEGKIKAAAMIRSGHHVTLTEQGQLIHTHLRPGSTQAVHPARQITQQGLSGEVKQLTLDAQHNLYALNDQGDIFKLDHRDWQGSLAAQSNGQWRPLELPATQGKIQQLSLNAKQQVTATTDAHQTLTLNQSQWQGAHTETPNDTVSQRNDLFARLSKAMKGTKLTKNGAQLTVSAQLGGMSGAESGKINSKWTSRLKAHVFQPTLDIPRPLKTVAYSAQHHWRGRDGLEPLYQQQHLLYEELDLMSKKLKTLPETPPSSSDLKTRLGNLELGEQAKGFTDAIEHLRHQLETSAEKQLMTLGQHQGIIDDQGAMRFDYRPSKRKAFTQALNMNRTGHRLSDELSTLWKQSPASKNSVPGQILSAFSALKLDMSHEKNHAPLGRRRDPNDQMSLVKSRLVLDTITLQKLDKLIEKAELLSGHQPSGTQLASLEKELLSISEQGYEQSLVKQATDKGIQSAKQAEQNYDVTKYFIRAMHDESHGVNLITRTALDAQDQTQLNQRLKSLLHTLQPNDTVSLSRGYSVDASATVIPTPLQNQPVSLFPTVGVSEKRNYSLDISGQEEGVQITLGGNLGPSASANFGMNKNALPAMLNQPNGDLKTSLNHGQQSFKPDLVAGAGLTANASYAQDNEITFTLKGNDIDQFIDGLTTGRLTPQNLIAKGQEHASIHGTKTSFSLDLALNLTARARLNLNDKDEEHTTYARAGAGLTAGINLATVSKDRLQTQGLDSNKMAVTTKNGVLNSASLSASADITLGNNHNFDKGLWAMPTKMSASISASLDNSVKVKGELKTKHAEPVSTKQLTELSKSLQEAFLDPDSANAIKQAGQLTSTQEKLQALTRHFAGETPRAPSTDDQHSALNELHKANLQQTAATRNAEVMGDAKMVVTNYNPKHLDQSGLVDFLTALVAPSHRHDLSQQIAQMIKQDPDFGAIIDQARSNANTHTAVTLELKDSVRQRLEKDFSQGKVSLEDVKKQLENPENRRIKSIMVVEKGQHKEGFSAPTPIISGSSSANIYMERDAGSIHFKYGRDQQLPKTYAVGGEITHQQANITDALADLKQQGLEVNR